MLKKQYRITDKKVYDRAYRGGKRISGRYLIVFIRENEMPGNRFGFVTSKKTGKAVTRNLVKRRLRALVQNELPRMKGNHDVVIVARYNIKEADFSALKKDFLIVMRKAGLC
ncbi:MAG: ribonuclease P protein component [Deltaproteobacteria bacterium]